MEFWTVVSVIAVVWTVMLIVAARTSGLGQLIFMLGPLLPGMVIGGWISILVEKVLGEKRDFFGWCLALGFLLYCPAAGYGLKKLYDYSENKNSKIESALTSEEERVLTELLLKKRQAE